MRVVLNGETAELKAMATVADAVEAVGADPEGRGVAVALAGEVVPRAEWPRRRLTEGESVEVVHAVQGG
jgi:sulfur carrier protein